MIKTFNSKGSTWIVLLANGFMEMLCINPWLPPIRRKWYIMRTVDYATVDI